MVDKSDYKEIRISTDELTGLLDKQTFYECAQDLIDTASEESEFAFIFFDLDNFKIFNVNYGYEIGDELLISIGYIIRDVFSGQLISRFSGDHFVVCANSVQIIPAIKNIRDRIKLVQKSVNVELKVGIYIYNGEETDVIRCCDRARMACISIKKKYDVAYRFYDEELGGNLKRKQEILDRLDEAIEKKYIKVYYQPIVRTITGKVCGWEALVRWNDPIKGMIYPNEFIPVLEEYRLIPKVDAFVIEEVLSRYHNDVVGSMTPVPVSLNLSRIDFEVFDVVAFIEKQMENYNCPKNMFHFEVTETAINDNSKLIIEQITNLRKKGYIVWMDDFGSGYSSLNLLKNYEFDLVKIDMDFLSQFETNDNGKIILKHIVSMIKNLNMHTLAEGVETQEQYDFLKSIGCEMIQGYLIGRPMPYLQGLECMRKDERALETNEDRYFYEELGKVDILRQNPLKNIDNSEIENPLPLAIAVSDEDGWKIVYTNSGFRITFAVFALEGIDNAEIILNNDTINVWAQKDRFYEICKHSKETKQTTAMDFMGAGRIINLRVRHICSGLDGDRDAYLVSLRSLSLFLNTDSDSRINDISRFMFSVYECVDLYGINNDYYENIYMNDSRLHIEYRGQSPREIIATLEDDVVHPDDKLFFHQFFDLETIEDRIAEEPSGATIGFFRVLDVKGNYVWKSITLSIMHFEDYDALLCCVSEASNEIARRMTNSQSERVKARVVDNNDLGVDVKPTFENIIQMLPIGVFWKDRERKFVGANQMFLDYYGLQSVDSIIGKTDEDMGWHINPELFKRDELSVINEGKVIKDVHGDCIVRGQVRKIVASKQPYYVDREIVGLVGYFKDITDELEEHSKLELLTQTDALTGLYNRRAFNEIIPRYVEQYKQDKTDFALMLLDIEKFKQINDMYGHDLGDEVLRRVGRILRKVAADNSVVVRFGGDEFIILHQYKNEAELESIRQEIRMAVSKENYIGQCQLSLRLSIGTAVYSETEDITKCVDQADKLMYLDKEKNRKG